MAKNMKCNLPEEKKQNFYELTFNNLMNDQALQKQFTDQKQKFIDECTKLTKRALKQYERQFSVEVTE